VLQDIFRDTPAYQYILEEGRIEGREEGRNEERQALLQDLRRVLLDIVQAHFPHVNELARATTNHSFRMLVYFST